MPDDAPDFQPPSNQIDDATPRGPMIVGALVVLLALGALVLAGRNARSNATVAVDPYVKNLQLSDFKLSQAENFVGGNVTYLEGKVQVHGEYWDAVGPAGLSVTGADEFRSVLVTEILRQVNGVKTVIDLSAQEAEELHRFLRAMVQA